MMTDSLWPVARLSSEWRAARRALDADPIDGDIEAEQDARGTGSSTSSRRTT